MNDLSLDSSLAENSAKVPFLVVVCGATATGKSGLAIALAQRFPAIILSADSRQVYRDFNIGTAKPTAAEQSLTPHYLIDICDPTESLTVAAYQQHAQTLIAQYHQTQGPKTQEQQAQDRQVQHSSAGTNDPLGHPDALAVSPQQNAPFKIPLLVGGTGLYIRAIAKGLKIPRVPPHPDLRAQLQTLGQSHIYALLRQVDPIAADKIHPHDQVRTLRALEVFYVTGHPISAQQGENPPPYPILHIGLDCAHGLEQRIEQRTQQMVEAGLLAEVAGLSQKYGEDLPLLNTLGYAEFRQCLAGKISPTEAQQLTVLHTRQFAKRQRTWFRACPEIEWFDAAAPDLIPRVAQRIQQFSDRLEP
jgi:tRNA dimethylallyltransferase